MKYPSILTIFLISIFHSQNLKAEKILYLAPMGSISHKIFDMGIAEALAKRGHQITFVSCFEPSKKIDNIREVVIQNYTLDNMMRNIFEDNDVIWPLMVETPHMCIESLDQPHIQALKNEKFHLIILSIFFNYCFLSFVHHFKVPFIYTSPAGFFGTFNDMAGNFDVPSITGSKVLEPGFPLNFKQRLGTIFMNELFSALESYYLHPKLLSLCIEGELCPPDMPPFAEFNKHASLAIINSVRTLEYPPRPAMPNVIYAGGAHIKPPKKLPKDLEEWVQGSGDEGFIFFSLGSVLNPDFLPEKYRHIIVKVFGSLKQRILWKWNQESMPDLPKNVKLQKWLPQPDLLGHPKLKLFITHGGLLSTLESSYNGIPVIGMPLFADQHTNMKGVQGEGWGKIMSWKKLEENAFRDLILEALSNKTMAEIAKQKSIIMKDRLLPPDEEAAYWVEYVLRHKGAPHLKSPITLMSWYEVYNMDVWAFIIFVAIAIVFIFLLVIKLILRRCFGIRKSKRNKRKME